MAARITLFVALAAVVGSGCGGEPEGLPPGPLGFRIAVTAGDPGAPDARLPFSLGGVTYTLDIEAVPTSAFPGGWVAVRSQPGDVLDVAAPGAAIRSNVQLVGGHATGVTVTLAKAYGDTRLWVEDAGFVPGPAAGSGCGNGIDDDGDGQTDYPEDTGCAYSNDDDETEGSHAVGLSPVLYFANPRIADVQGLSSMPPLAGRSITVNEGTLIVTAVTVDGMAVTDIAETRGYASILAYNYNTPAGVRVCDKLDDISGIVGEFFGLTELGYPSWTRNPDWPRPVLPDGPDTCPVPEPVELTPALIGDAVAMESLESGLVKVTNGTVSVRFVDCDLNGNGSIDFDTPEETCGDDCDSSPDCTELTNYSRYGQFGLTATDTSTGDQTKVLAITRGAAPDFDVQAHAGETVALVRGLLAQVEFLNVPWIIELRCADDIVLSGTARPIWQACVPPPDDDEGYER